MQKVRKQKYIGYNIHKVRKRLGLNQNQVVAKMQLMGSNISRTSYSKMEHGFRNIAAEEMVMLHLILNIDYEDFFKGIDI